jgi:23S rRNA (pseudouridine1915-N3)-methyltransferase
MRGSPFEDDVAHYERLLGRLARLELVELREAGTDAARRAEAMRKEAAAIAARLPKGAFVCALDRQGDSSSSDELASFLEQRRQSGRDLCFVVGGAFGLDSEVLVRADRRLSLGPMTLPHGLARVVLLEQLFRAHKILAGEPYHY